MTNTDFDTLDAMLSARHSCRGFHPEPVDRKTIEAIITAAGKVPSWCNSQPWHLTVTSAAETERLRAHLHQAAQDAPHAPDIAFPERYEGCYRDRRSDCGWQLYDAVGVGRGDRDGSRRQMLENFRFFGAPHIALVTSPKELGTYGVLDCGAFVTAFMLAAQALGVASIAQAAVAGHAPILRDWFGLSAERAILCAISFGYEDRDHPANSFRTARAPLSELVDWR